MSAKDAKGKSIPSWVRYITKIVAAGSHSNSSVGFGLYCPAEAIVTLTPMDNSASIQMTLSAGYHPILIKSVTTTDIDIFALYPFDPS